jgi:formylglycine-generating enzyme required for sulfatase activity
MTFKLIILAIIFVLTSGAFFTDYFKQHKILVFLAAIMAIISSLFLLQDIVSSIKDDVVADLNTNDTQNHSQQNSFQAQLEQQQQKKAALEAELEALKKLEQEQQETAALQAKLEALKKKNEFTPGKVFRDRLADGSDGPEMVMIPAGSFRMGDIQGDGRSNEQPVHEVSVGKFAMGKYEVTFAEYDKFAEATGRKKPNDRGWGRGNRPVINVSWNDATAYAKWLSDETGKQYRLPTEAEWEYAARAGTDTKYWWGNTASHEYANYGTDNCCSGLAKGKDRWEYTSPVGSFAANQFGLYDTSGNLWEWTCSEYTDKYTGKEKVCINNNSNKNRVLRGGSWVNFPAYLRAAGRHWLTPDYRYVYCGFRLVVLRAAWTK